MFNANAPSPDDLPSRRQLLRSTVLAAASALLLLVTVVLPAEHGVDPTRVGRLLGLTRMGEIKRSLAEEARDEAARAKEARLAQAPAAAAPAVPAPTEDPSSAPDGRSDRVSVRLEPDEGVEIKLAMAAGERVSYRWSTDSGKANWDAHADSKALEIKYHSYGKGSSASEAGELEAAFDGNHGWFWRNRGREPLTVTLEVSGSYADLLRWP